MKKMNLKNRSYMLDTESISLLKKLAEKQKTSESAALRMMITEHCKLEEP